MVYQITDRTKENARKLGVEVKRSSKANKKLDVYKNGELVASIGDTRYSDYPTYIKEKGLDYANERKRLYNIRHKNESSGGFYAKKLLWE